MADHSKLQSNDETQSTNKPQHSDMPQSKNNTQSERGFDVERLEEHNDDVHADKKPNSSGAPANPSQPQKQTGGSLFRDPNAKKWFPGGAHLRPLVASDGAPLRTGNTPSPRSPDDPEFLAAQHAKQTDDEKSGGTGTAKVENWEAGEDENLRVSTEDRGQKQARGRPGPRVRNSYRRTPTPHPYADSDNDDTDNDSN